MSTNTRSAWPFWRRYLNLAQPRLGARVVACNDEFFGAAERLLQPEAAIFVPGKYDDHGKWMDGWETRRRREPGFDWCVVALGAPARLFGVDIDTSHFNGNQPESATLEAATLPPGRDPDDATQWTELVSRAPLGPDSQHRIEVQCPSPITHLRLNIFPDGGVARLRAYGLIEDDHLARGSSDEEQLVDLAAALCGGSVVAASDEHFGAAVNLLLPERGIHMGDGWETARRRGEGFDWAVIALGCPGTVERVCVDTAHFKGNFPHECSIQVCASGTFEPGDDSELGEISASWPQLLDRQRLQANHEHEFDVSNTNLGEVSHVRLNMYPDGGISRLRVWGRPAAARDQ